MPFDHKTDREILIEIHAKQGFMLEKQETHSKKLEAHSERLSKLEKWPTRIMAVGATIGGILGIGASNSADFIKKVFF